MRNNLCPCCGRHCYLDEPQCERGVHYAQTGEVPPRKPRPDGAAQNHPGAERKRLFHSLDRESKTIWTLYRIGGILRTLPVQDQSAPTPEEKQLYAELLSCLREEDKADLLMLLEKLSHSMLHRNSPKAEETGKKA